MTRGTPTWTTKGSSKSNVKKVPDFRKLHSKWNKKIEKVSVCWEGYVGVCGGGGGGLT